MRVLVLTITTCLILQIQKNIEKPHGRGVFLMKNLADSVEFLNEGSKVKMDFNLDDTLLKEVQEDKEKENNEPSK